MALSPAEALLLDSFTDKFEEVYQQWMTLYPILVREQYEPRLIPKLDEAMGDVYEERQYMCTALLPGVPDDNT